MAFITELWLPILLATVGVFMASAIVWMATPLHKKDFLDPPDESTILGAIRTHDFRPGMYYLPWCKGGNRQDPAYLEKAKQGPWAMVIVPDGMPNFGRSLGLWFVNCLVLSVFVAYITSHALPLRAGAAAPLVGGAPYLKVFQVAGAATFMAHAGMAAHDTIWKGLGWRYTFGKLVDGLIYACVTAGFFGWLWPR